MIRPYIPRAPGWTAPTYVHPDLRPALQETFGVIVYHEQVMRTLAALAGYDLTYADHVRRHLDDEDAAGPARGLPRARDRRAGSIPTPPSGRGMTSPSSRRFGFCKAHAAAFAVPTYRSSWLKTHYPAQFLSGILTHDPGMYPRRLLLDDARRRGVPILPLDVNRSEPEYVVEETDRRRVRHPDGAAGRARDLRRPRSARSWPRAPSGRSATWATSCGAPSVARPVAEALAHAGAFDALGRGENRRGHLYEAITVEAPREGDQLTLADTDARHAHAFADYTDAEVVRAELEVFGLDATRHLVSFFEPLLRDLGVTRARDLPRSARGSG